MDKTHKLEVIDYFQNSTKSAQRISCVSEVMFGLLKNFDQNLDLVVEIVDCDNLTASDDVAGCVTGGYTTKVGKKYHIKVLAEFVDGCIADSQNNVLEAILYHELVHVSDMIFFAIGGYEISAKARSFDEYLKRLGFLFWTEYYAYSLEFAKYSNFEHITLYRLLVLYRQISKFFEKIRFKSSIAKERKFFLMIKYFVYSGAFYLGWYHSVGQDRCTLSSSTIKSPEYNVVIQFLNGTVKYLKSLSNRKPSAHEVLMQLGDYILKHIYAKFNYSLVKDRAQVVLFRSIKK